MLEEIKTFLKGLIYENGVPSRTGIISIIFALAFLIGSAYLLMYGITWPHYETFAVTTTGGGVGGLVANKFINSTKNSEAGKFPDKTTPPTGGDKE